MRYNPLNKIMEQVKAGKTEFKVGDFSFEVKKNEIDNVLELRVDGRHKSNPAQRITLYTYPKENWKIDIV